MNNEGQYIKMYDFLLDINMEDETVKEGTIEWAKNIGSKIDLEEWDQLWKNNIKCIKAVALK